MAHVVIRGQGVAASCCARLLGAAGIGVSVEETDRPKLPAILLGEATQKLLGDILGREDLFRGLPRIEQRVVAWGTSSKPVALPHSAVVISESALLELLGPKLSHDARAATAEPAWTVFASRPLPAGSVEHDFGTRKATALAIELRNGPRGQRSSAAACWIESLENGWLFLIPGGGGAGWLLAVGGEPQLLLAESRVIAEQILISTRAGAEFPAYPGIADPLYGPGWLCCGTAALAFDPLCGDGAGHAIREAILVAAVIRAAAKGADAGDVLAHYGARLLAGFKRHLEICREFYTIGGRSPWWETELNSVRKGIAWCDRQLSPGARFRYRLNGFELQPIH